MELYFHNDWQRPMFMDWNEALKSNGDREYCLTEDDRLILCELQEVLISSNLQNCQNWLFLNSLIMSWYLSSLNTPRSLLWAKVNVSLHRKLSFNSVCHTESRWQTQFELQHLQTLLSNKRNLILTDTRTNANATV